MDLRSAVVAGGGLGLVLMALAWWVAPPPTRSGGADRTRSAAPVQAPAPRYVPTGPQIRPVPVAPSREGGAPPRPPEQPGMEEAFQQLRADARAFAESAFTVDVPEGATPEEEDARLKEAFNERVKQFGALERQLAVFAKRDAHRAAAAWTDIADIRLTLAEDYLAAVPAHLAPEQAAVVAESASIRADKMRGAASDALEAASAAPDITPEERAAMEAAGRRLQASLDE